MAELTSKELQLTNGFLAITDEVHEAIRNGDYLDEFCDHLKEFMLDYLDKEGLERNTRNMGEATFAFAYHFWTFSRLMVAGVLNEHKLREATKSK